jgi:hypothetical protein
MVMNVYDWNPKFRCSIVADERPQLTNKSYFSSAYMRQTGIGIETPRPVIKSRMKWWDPIRIPIKTCLAGSDWCKHLSLIRAGLPYGMISNTTGQVFITASYRHVCAATYQPTTC